MGVGVGLTVIVNVLAVPEHPLATGVTTILAIMGVVPLLTAVNEAIVPVPLAASPIPGLSLVQLYAVPVTPDPAKAMAVVLAALQNV